jgi:hypothetical protein
VADGEPAPQHDLADIPQRQSVAQPARHHERDDIARQRRAVPGCRRYVRRIVARSPGTVTVAEPLATLCIAIGPPFNGNSSITVVNFV